MSVDIINFGEESENEAILREFFNAVNSNENKTAGRNNINGNKNDHQVSTI